MKPIQPMAFAVPILMLAARAGVAEARERTQIPEQYKWDLTEIYPSDEAWRTAKQDLVARIPGLESYKGKLGESAAELLEALDTLHDLEKQLSRLYVYAGMSADQDTRVTSYQAMKQEIQQAASSFAAQSAFFEPEILRLDRSRIDGFLAELPKLEVYEHYLDDILRRKAHTGTDGEERIIAEASLMARGPQSVYGIFADADFPYPSLTLSDGQTVTLNQAAFSRYRALPNREDRKNVFAAFFGALGKFERTFGTTLNASVQRDLFYMKARNYGSCLESALDANNVPVSVYHGLVDGVNQNLSTFHRYLKLRQRILGLDQLHYYDLYAPLVEEVDLDYSPEEAQTLILEALAPLGEDYVKTVKRAFDSRWIDLFPTPGKRSGAYSNGGAYDVHPYMLLNYNDKYTDVSTLAHELGHTMQSYYSNKAQPYATAGYPIFVAEVASTFNEALLIESMLKQIEDPKARLSLLGNYLEGIKGTVFRQTQFAELELRMHERAERGEPLTGEALSDLYQEITRKYYGHEAGVCVVDDDVRYEWSFIPHFYYNFYVFQYVTGMTAATALAASAALSERVLAGDAAATRSYLRFLAAGGSKYPVELLKDAGVDMTTAEPLELTMRKMNRVIDEMETLLDQMGR
jgi:oligoendopeptidase F